MRGILQQSLTKHFYGLSWSKNSEDGLDRVSQGSIGLELVANRFAQQVLDLELRDQA